MIHVFGNRHTDQLATRIAEAVSSGWIGCGPKVAEFEERVTQRVGRPFVMTNNGSNALHLALKLIDLPVGSKIVLPSFTFVACAHAVLLAGHVPVFCDVGLDGNVTAGHIEPLIEGAQAIMVVHYGGRPVDMAPIMSFGKPVIEDAAHAVDSMYHGVHCGAIGDIGVLSFDPIKNISTPDAGGVILSSELVTQAKCLRDLGISSTGLSSSKESRWWEHGVTDVFPKYLPNDISAIFALDQLEYLPSNQIRRKSIWAIYQDELSRLDWIIPEDDVLANTTHSHFTYLARVPGRRDEFATYLRGHGIYTTLRFHPLHCLPLFAGYSSSSLGNTKVLMEEGINLPLHPGLSGSDVDRIVSVIKTF